MILENKIETRTEDKSTITDQAEVILAHRYYLKDTDGNRQTLTATITHLLEADEIHDKKIMYLAQEMEKQWMNIEQIALVTGAEKYCTEKPQKPP